MRSKTDTAYVSLIYSTEPKTTKWEKLKKKVKTDTLGNMGKRLGESVESVPEKKKATVVPSLPFLLLSPFPLTNIYAFML